MAQGQGREIFGDKQFARPPFQSLPEIDFNARKRELEVSDEKVSERFLVFVTVNIETRDLMPADVNARKIPVR